MSKKKLYHQFACSSLMLPEHRRRLSRHREQARREEERRLPCLDEQRQEEFQRALECALRGGLVLKVTLLDETGRHTLAGTPLKPAAAGFLRLQTAAGVRTVPAGRIISLELEPGAET